MTTWRGTRSSSAACGHLIALAIVAGCLAPVASRASEPGAWRLLADAPAFPPTLHIPMAVYDSVRHRVLAVDGTYADRPTEVHFFEPAPVPRWSVLEVSGPRPGVHYLSSVTMDPLRDRLLLVGAHPGGIGGNMEVWSLALSGAPGWQRLTTAGVQIPLRYGHSTIYDPIHDRLILCGGSTSSAVDLWALSLSTLEWTALAPLGQVPGAREGHGAIYDPVGRRMIMFGGHYEIGARGFRNDVWMLSLGDTLVWSQMFPAGSLPGARSAFGTVYDPVRRQMLVHGGVNDQSGVEPDDLWALSLEGTPAWKKIVTENTLRGRSYSIDVYDPVEDRLLSCGGGGATRRPPRSHSPTRSAGARCCPRSRCPRHLHGPGMLSSMTRGAIVLL